MANFTKEQIDSERQKRINAVRAVLVSRSLLEFTKFTFDGNYSVNWHHKLIADEIDQWLISSVPYNLMITIPPRHGKSELCARRLPGYVFGKFPDAQILFASYSADIATDMGRDAQRVIMSEKYNEVFPHIHLATSKERHQGIAVRRGSKFNIVGHRGYYQAAGIGGSFTGRGANFGIIDDPIKGRAEAESPTIRKDCIEWYKGVFRTRLQKNGRILMLLTRWHREDLAGWCIKQMQTNPKADKWKVVSLPAIFEKQEFNHPKDKRSEGDALWLAEFSESELAKTRATIGVYDWNALYQQRPDPPGGAVFKRYWAKIIEPNELPVGLFWVRYWDLAVTAKTKADFTASGQMAIDEHTNIYVRGFIREQQEWPVIYQLFKNVSKAEAIPVGIEAQGVQKGFFQSLISDPDLKDIDIRASDVEADKLTRALPWIARAQANKFNVVRGQGLDEYLDELVEFTGQGDTHDDQVDWTSGAYRMLSEYQPAIFEVVGTYK